MSNELVAREQQHAQYIDHNLAVIANQSKLNEKDLAFFAIQCKRTGLDPITRQIYALPIGGKLTITASIDGLRLIAERSGKYEGQTPAMWCGEDGKWVDVWLDSKPPKACKVGVYKSGFREALYATALFNEYVTTSGPMWKKMPALMISKVAESLALRKAFPNEMSGIYSENEMDQASLDLAKDVTEPKKHIVEKVADVAAQAILEPIDFGSYVINFGKKMAGKKLTDFHVDDHIGMLTWLDDQVKKNGKPLSDKAKDYYDVANAYVKSQIGDPPPKLDDEEQLPF